MCKQLFLLKRVPRDQDIRNALVITDAGLPAQEVKLSVCMLRASDNNCLSENASLHFRVVELYLFSVYLIILSKALITEQNGTVITE
jgi:hypothetical protein